MQEISLTTNASLIKTLNETFNACDNATGTVDCTQPASLLRHPVGALATFDHVYTAPGLYWVTVWVRGVVPGKNKSDTVTSNVSVVVTVRPTLSDETGLVLLLIPESAYVDEPLRLIILIQNRAPDIGIAMDSDDDAGKRSLNVVDTSTKTTLREVTDSSRYRNRYRVAARSRPHSTNVDEVTIVYSRLDVVHTFYAVGDRRITVTVAKVRPEFADDRFTISTMVSVCQRPTLADEVGAVVVVPRKPAYVDEPVEFVYAVQRPHAELEYRLDFGDGLRWSTVVSANSTIHLPGWLKNSDLKSLRHVRELLVVFQPAHSLK